MIICDYIDDKILKKHKNSKEIVLTYIEQNEKYFDNQISFNQFFSSETFLNLFDEDIYLSEVFKIIKENFAYNFPFGKELYNSIEHKLLRYKLIFNILNLIEKSNINEVIYLYREDIVLLQIIKLRGYKVVSRSRGEIFFYHKFKDNFVGIAAYIYAMTIKNFSRKIRIISNEHLNEYFIYLFGKETNSHEFINKFNEFNYVIPSIDSLRIRYLSKRLENVNIVNLKRFKSLGYYKLFLEIINNSFKDKLKTFIKIPPIISKREFNLIFSYYKNLEILNKTKGIVVSQNYHGLERFIIETSSKMIKKVEINHGFPSLVVPPNYNSQYENITEILIYGKGDEQVYLNRFKKIESPKLIKIGNPIFDNYMNHKLVKSNEICLFLILQPSDGGHDIIGEAVDYFLKSIKLLKIKGVIKFHQRQTIAEIKYVKKQMSYHQVNDYVETKFSLKDTDILSKKLIILSPDSTLSIELIFTKNIIIYLDIFRLSRTIQLDQFGYALSVNSFDELANKLVFLVENFNKVLDEKLLKWEKTAKYFTSYEKNISFSNKLIKYLKSF